MQKHSHRGESAFAKRYTNKIDRFEDQVRRAAKPVNLIDHDAVSQLTQWQVWTVVATINFISVTLCKSTLTVLHGLRLDAVPNRNLFAKQNR